MKKALIIPDCHIPYHNRKAYDLMIKVAIQLEPDEIVILGDYLDFYSVSSHAKDPRVLGHLVSEVEEGNKCLDEIDRLFHGAKKVYLEGNHENRLERYLIDKAPSLFGLSSTEHILKLNQRHNWKFVGYGPNQKHNVLGGKLIAKHTPIANTAALTARKAMCSVTYGHIHRIEQSYAVGITGEQHIAFSCGWLGDIRNDLIFSYVKNHHEWQLGFGIVYVEDSGNFHHNIIRIDETNSCVFNGKKFKV